MTIRRLIDVVDGDGAAMREWHRVRAAKQGRGRQCGSDEKRVSRNCQLVLRRPQW
jgi:hypothetical protein